MVNLQENQSAKGCILEFVYFNLLRNILLFSHCNIYIYRILRSCYRRLAWVGFEPMTIEFRSDSLLTELSGHEFNSHSEPTLFSYSSFTFSSVFRFHFSYCFRQSPHIAQSKCDRGNHVSVAEYIDAYVIHHWRVFRSSYRKLAWVGFEPTISEFHSDALNVWAIRPWVWLSLSQS